MKCPRCNFGNPEGIKFCGGCGAKLERICPKCNSPNPPEFNFCGECGHNLSLPSDPSPKELPFEEKLAKVQRYLPKGLTEKIPAQRGNGTHRMYSVINQNIDRILASVDVGLDIHTYLNLMNRFGSVNVVQDTEFQRKYCVYWRLNAARLSQNFCAAYFELMERLRARSNLDVEAIIRQLYAVPTHKNGKKSLQFSFSSKLLHTLNPHKPIYDSNVASFFSFSAPNPNKSFEFRMRSFLDFYNILCTEYERILRHGLLQQPITQFRKLFRLSDAYTDEKIIDTLIWRTEDLRKKGAI